MALVVLGSESLDELAGYVKEYFSPVPRGNVPRNTFENQGFPFQVWRILCAIFGFWWKGTRLCALFIGQRCLGLLRPL